jgi:hypothetical protein
MKRNHVGRLPPAEQFGKWTRDAEERHMATTKKTGTKKTAKAETFKVPRTAKQLAAGILARMKRSPGYWNELAAEMASRTHPQAPTRAAQVMPRETPATH